MFGSTTLQPTGVTQDSASQGGSGQGGRGNSIVPPRGRYVPPNIKYVSINVFINFM